jgi:hypothetical protein
MYLASRVPTLRAVVAGAAPIWFLGYKLNPDGSTGLLRVEAGSRDLEEHRAIAVVLIIVNREAGPPRYGAARRTGLQQNMRMKSTNTAITISCSVTGASSG